MSEWVTRTIAESADILDNMRIPVSEEVRAENPGDTPYYGANGLQGYIAGHIFDEPLILIAEDGGYFDEFENRPIAYRISGKSWVNNHAHILKAKPGTDSDFLFFSLQHKNITPFIKGGTRAKLNKAELQTIPIYIPRSLGQQKKIATILTSIDTAIKKTEDLIAKYQQIKSGLMHDLFTRGVLPNGQLRPPREQAPELYQETVIGWIPKEWVTTRIEDLCSEIVDCPHSTPEYQTAGIPCIRTADMVPGALLLEQAYKVSSAVYIRRVERLVPKPGDIIYSREGERLGIASPVGEEKVCLGQRVMLLRAAGDVSAQFLMWAMNMPSFYCQVIKGLGATTSPHVNVGDIKRIIVPKPSAAEQQQIGLLIANAHLKIKSEMLYKKKLSREKLGLMQDLLTGEIKVKIDTNAMEPADA